MARKHRKKELKQAGITEKLLLEVETWWHNTFAEMIVEKEKREQNYRIKNGVREPSNYEFTDAMLGDKDVYRKKNVVWDYPAYIYDNMPELVIPKKIRDIINLAHGRTQ